MQLQSVLCEVYSKDASRELMGLLVSTKQPVRYSAARGALGIHPQEFQRAVRSLESMALLGRRLARSGRGRQASVLLEPTFTGRGVVGLWRGMEAEARRDKLLAATLEFPATGRTPQDEVDDAHGFQA